MFCAVFWHNIFFSRVTETAITILKTRKTFPTKLLWFILCRRNGWQTKWNGEVNHKTSSYYFSKMGVLAHLFWPFCCLQLYHLIPSLLPINPCLARPISNFPSAFPLFHLHTSNPIGVLRTFSALPYCWCYMCLM